jgi:hypothetical protein
MYQQIDLIKDKSFTELLPSCLSAVYGKIKEVDCLYLIRQGHNQRYFLPDTFDWLTAPQWLASYEGFRDILIQELRAHETITPEDALAIVKQGFWAHLSQVLPLKFGQRFQTPSSRDRIKSHLKKNSFLREVVAPFMKVWRSRLAASDDLALGALLSRRSPYHEDFMPFYQLVDVQGGGGG